MTNHQWTRCRLLTAALGAILCASTAQAQYATDSRWDFHGQVGGAYDQRFALAVSAGPSVRVRRFTVRTMAEVTLSSAIPVDSLIGTDPQRQCSTYRGRGVEPDNSFPCTFQSGTRMALNAEVLVPYGPQAGVSLGGGFRVAHRLTPLMIVNVRSVEGKFENIETTVRFGLGYLSVQIGSSVLSGLR